jgi:hypothetical protein
MSRRFLAVGDQPPLWPLARIAWLIPRASGCQRASPDLFVQCTIKARIIVMLPFIVSFFRRKRGFVWSPDVDLSDPYVAAALAPMTHS